MQAGAVCDYLWCAAERTSYLFGANAPVCVVELVGEDVPVACEGFIPAEEDGGRSVGHRLQVGSWTRHLYWRGEERTTKKHERQQLDIYMFTITIVCPEKVKSLWMQIYSGLFLSHVIRLC